jgi:hypothetical protein
VAYSEEKVKDIGYKASPCYKPFSVGNASDRFLPLKPLLILILRINEGGSQ